MRPSVPAPRRVTFWVEYIDPRRACYYLRLSHEENREVDWAKVREIARDIEAGRWRLNNHLLGFDGKGRLVDGQHRLHAIVQAGIAVEVGVMRNLEWHD